MCYHVDMDNKYLSNKNVIALVQYHFVFCPRYRRKIFQIDGLQEQFEQIVREKGEALGIRILTLRCGADYVYLHVQCLPEQSPSFIMRQLKGATSLPLRTAFFKLSSATSLWTRGYFVSTEDVLADSVVEAYVREQKTRE